MKLKNISLKKFKLLKLQLTKSKIYKSYNFVENQNFDFLELHFKKALQIIYNYHYYDKKIAFISIPESAQKDWKKAIHRTNHFFIPKSVWIQGVLLNKKSIFKNIQRQVSMSPLNKNIESLFLIQQKLDLVVIFDNDSEFGILKEINKLKIPVIVVGTNLKLRETFLYSVYGNFKFLNKKINNVLLLLLTSIFKK